MDRLTARRAPTPALALVALACLTSAACRGSDGYEGPFAAEVREAVPRIERATGLAFREPPRLETRSRAQVREFLEARFEEELPQAELRGAERLYKRLGLVADSTDLRQLYLALLTEQIVGFYDPRTQVLYVVEEAPAVQRSAIITHELIHALQDQYVDLEALQQIEAQNDRSVAAQAVIEGQAMYEQLEATLGGGDVESRLPGGWNAIRESIRENRSTMPLFGAAPRIVQETLIFPYLSGAEFVREAGGAGETDGRLLFQRLPQSTEQILHPERWRGADADAPTRVVLPAPAAGEVVFQNTLGEFETRVLLFEQLGDQAATVRGAAGWDGDRVAVVNTAAGEALLWASVWDTSADADEFAALVARALARRYGAPAPGAAQGELVTAGRRVFVRRAEIAGRPAVLVDDLPDALAAPLLDPAGVTLEELPATRSVLR